MTDLDRLRQAAVDAAVQSPYLSAKLYPIGGPRDAYALPAAPGKHRAAQDDIPMPPDDWLVKWGGAEAFHSGGKKDAERMRDLTAAHGFRFAPGARVLEFGCARGRMLRWLQETAMGCEIWGVDLDAADIAWCHQHMSPPFRFLTTTSSPHLPFEDNTFDFIYAGSVFTHISDLADAWLLELRRLLRPGGQLYVTVHDNHCVQLLYTRGYVAGSSWWSAVMKEYEQITEGRALADFKMVTILRGRPAAEVVFYDRDHLLQHWGRFFKILSVVKEAYAGVQTAILMVKTPPSPEAARAPGAGRAPAAGSLPASSRPWLLAFLARRLPPSVKVRLRAATRLWRRPFPAPSHSAGTVATSTPSPAPPDPQPAARRGAARPGRTVSSGRDRVVDSRLSEQLRPGGCASHRDAELYRRGAAPLPLHP